MGKVTGESGAGEQPPASLPPHSAVRIAPSHSGQSSGSERRKLEFTQYAEGRAEIKQGSPNSQPDALPLPEVWTHRSFNRTAPPLHFY